VIERWPRGLVLGAALVLLGASLGPIAAPYREAVAAACAGVILMITWGGRR
jgi:hypothetical protein